MLLNNDSGCTIENRLGWGWGVVVVVRSRDQLEAFAIIQTNDDGSFDSEIAMEMVKGCWILNLFKGMANRIC